MATATIAYMEDYIRKLRKAMQVKHGLSYIHVLLPCPTGWRFSTEKTVELARLAVQTDYFPLWEAEDGRLRFTKRIFFPKGLNKYTGQIGKFAHLTRDEVKAMQRDVRAYLAQLRRLS